MASFTRQMSTDQFEAIFPTDDACKAYLTMYRWPDGVVKCPRCGNDKVWELKARPYHWLCRGCSEQGHRFFVTVGTVFANSNIGLRAWFNVIYLMLTGKKGMGASQIHRMMGFGSYETAHSMCHRVRSALVDPEFRKLVGIVEVDETYVGGKNENRQWDEKTPGTGSMGKETVMGAVSRGSDVVAHVIRGTDTATMEGFVREAVSTKVNLLATDEHSGYRSLGRDYPHDYVRHARGKYVAGAVHTQTIDGFWSPLKRGIIGAYHKVSAKYVRLYVAASEFRYNNRKNQDIFGAAVARC